MSIKQMRTNSSLCRKLFCFCCSFQTLPGHCALMISWSDGEGVAVRRLDGPGAEALLQQVRPQHVLGLLVRLSHPLQARSNMRRRENNNEGLTERLTTLTRFTAKDFIKSAVNEKWCSVSWRLKPGRLTVTVSIVTLLLKAFSRFSCWRQVVIIQAANCKS